MRRESRLTRGRDEGEDIRLRAFPRCNRRTQVRPPRAPPSLAPSLRLSPRARSSRCALVPLPCKLRVCSLLAQGRLLPWSPVPRLIRSFAPTLQCVVAPPAAAVAAAATSASATAAVQRDSRGHGRSNRLKRGATAGAQPRTVDRSMATIAGAAADRLRAAAVLDCFVCAVRSDAHHLAAPRAAGRRRVVIGVCAVCSVWRV